MEILEKAMYIRFYKFLDTFKCLYKKHIGFRNFPSRNHALVSITEEIRQVLYKDEFACDVFLDFQKAFDTVDHNTKLNHHGIRGVNLDWFQSYLAKSKTATFNRKILFLTKQ